MGPAAAALTVARANGISPAVRGGGCLLGDVRVQIIGGCGGHWTMTEKTADFLS
jgi:hypothetical protein